MQTSYEIVSDAAAMLALRREWEDLCTRSPGHYLGQTFDWARVSWETTAEPRGRRLHCLVARYDGRVGLIWPLVTFRGRRHSVAHPLGSETSEYSAVLIETCADAEQRVAAAWRVLRATCRCDLIELPNVRSDSVLGAMLSRSAGLALTFPTSAPWVSWAGIADWDTYCRGLSSARRSGLNRKLKRLQEAGDLRFEAVTEPRRCEAILNWMIEHKRAWLHKTGLHNDWLLSREYRAFLSASTAAFGPAGRRVVFTLELDGCVVAAELSSVHEARVEWFMGAHDPEYGKHSPGQLLKEHCLRWAFDRRLDYDLRIGNEPEKLIWSNREGEAASYVVAISTQGAVHVLANNLRSFAAQHVKPERRAAVKAALRRAAGMRPKLSRKGEAVSSGACDTSSG